MVVGIFPRSFYRNQKYLRIFQNFLQKRHFQSSPASFPQAHFLWPELIQVPACLQSYLQGLGLIKTPTPYYFSPLLALSFPEVAGSAMLCPCLPMLCPSSTPWQTVILTRTLAHSSLFHPITHFFIRSPTASWIQFLSPSAHQFLWPSVLLCPTPLWQSASFFQLRFIHFSQSSKPSAHKKTTGDHSGRGEPPRGKTEQG